MNTPAPQTAEPPRKHGCLKAALITLGVGFVLFVSLFILMIVLANRETKVLKEAAAPFITKIQANEIEAAYSLASPSYRASVKLEDLESFVSETNLAGFTNADWRYASAGTAGESAIEGSVTTAKGAIVPILVTLVEEGDSFAVSGLSKKENPKAEKEDGSKTTVTTWAQKESKTKSGSWSWSTAKLENLRFVAPSLSDDDPPVFPADIPKIVLEADLKNAPPKTDVTASFVLVESADGAIKNQVVIQRKIEAEKGGVVTFWFERKDPVMAAGDWVVQLFIDGKPKGEKAFKVLMDFDDLTRKAEAGDAEAQLVVGLAHCHLVIGYTGPVNEAESAKWLGKSAEQGNRTAQFYLGDSYMNGRGVPTDPTTALSWLKKSAGQGLPEAQNALGTIYRDGELVESDLDAAASWYAKASDQGDLTGTTRLGELFLNFGEEEQKTKGAELIQSAAEGGFPEAQFVMGQLYEFGIVVAADPAKARGWFQQAAANGVPDAVEALKRLDEEAKE